MANKAFKYRLYLTEWQKVLLARTFGCVRFVYNKVLEEQERRYAEGEKHMSKTDMNNWCNRVLKPQYDFLRAPDKFALTNALYHLDDSYKRFFKHIGGHPKFKSKHKSRYSYTTNYTNGNIEVLDKSVKLPKLGIVKATVHRKAPEGYSIKSATISMERDGTYYVSVLYTYDREIPLAEIRTAAGLDYKSDGLFVSSHGETCGSPKYFRKAQTRLAKEQHRLSRKKGARKGERPSNRYLKQKTKVAKCHRHVANQRKDFLHKTSTAMTKRYDVICVEDLDMKALANKGYGNGKATYDNGYGMFVDMLGYKLHDQGKRLVVISKWYPSSQTCSCCGNKNPAVKALSVRKWTCPACGAVHDRDVNAARNILREGLRILSEDTA